MEEDGRGEIHECYRQDLLDQAGVWSLSFASPPGSKAFQMVRQCRDLPVTALSMLRQLPSEFISGSQAEMRLIVEHLAQASIEAEAVLLIAPRLSVD
jgi:hypothetical protein